MRIAVMLLGLTLIGASTAVGAEPSVASDDEIWIANISAEPAICNIRVARKVRFAELTNTPAKWLGQCVAVDGYWRGRTLFVSKRAAKDFDGAQGQLGLYGRDELLDRAPRRPRAYTAIGKVGDCKRLWDAASMVLGYCHYRANGPYLAVAELKGR